MAYLSDKTPTIVITVTTMRTAIREKLYAGGIGKQAISVLINDYAVPDRSGNERMIMGTPRRPVENIPLERRADFLEALEAYKSTVLIYPFESKQIA
jgi:hypothetical protein